MAFADLASASGTFVDVVVDMNPADCDLGFDAPVASEKPGVAIADAGADGPSLIAVVAELGKINAKNVAGEAYMADIVFTADRIQSDEVARGGLAEPVASFGLDKPVFPTALIGDIPRVEVG